MHLLLKTLTSNRHTRRSTDDRADPLRMQHTLIVARQAAVVLQRADVQRAVRELRPKRVRNAEVQSVGTAPPNGGRAQARFLLAGAALLMDGRCGRRAVQRPGARQKDGIAGGDDDIGRLGFEFQRCGWKKRGKIEAYGHKCARAQAVRALSARNYAGNLFAFVLMV